MTKNCTIRPVKATDLDQLLVWRNQPDVRLNMLTQHSISMSEHREWYERNSKDSSRRLLIVEQGAQALGFVQFTGVSHGSTADWGFYLAEGAPKRSGRNLGITALSFAFLKLELHKVCGQALAFNVASIGFHKRLGFQQEGILRQQQQINGSYHDLVCFGLLHDEWLANDWSCINE